MPINLLAMHQVQRSIGITFQRGRGLFKVCCGKHVGQDGKLRPTIHWLGRDPEHALYVAFTVRKRWQLVQRSGRDRWDTEDLAAIKAFVAQGGQLFAEAAERIARQRRELDEQERALRAMTFAVPNARSLATSDGTSLKPPAPSPPPPAPTLYKAIEAYLDSLKQRPVSEGHRERAAQILNLNLKSARKDCPLEQVDFAWLDGLANYFKGRPKSLKRGKKRISAETAAIILRYLKTFFVWLDDASWGGWQGPRKLAKLFRCTPTDLMTPVELKEAGTIKQFDVETLRKLYAAGNDFVRCCMLLGLFAGCTQQELSVLEKSEFDLDAATLHHFRHKTRVEGRFWLPPELVELLRKRFAKRKRDKLAFRTPEGNALVTFKNGRKAADAVRRSWDELREQPELADALSFKYLRKFLADWMTRNGGDEMGQIALSHSRKTVLAKNYTTARQFQKFSLLQQQMYRELGEAKVFSGISEDAKRGQHNLTASVAA